MTGVEILATEEVAVAWASWNWLAFFGGIVIVAGLFAIIGALVGSVNGVQDGWICFIAGSLIGGLILGVSMGTSLVEPTEYETHYKVTISDEVPMNEFLERYEIIDQEGKIFTVREVKE